MLQPYLTLSARVNIIQDILDAYATSVFRDDDGKEFIQVPLQELRDRGLPNSALNPAYWSGTSSGLHAAVMCGKYVKFSEKYRVIRFYPLTVEQKLIYQQRLAKKRQDRVSIREGRREFVESIKREGAE